MTTPSHGPGSRAVGHGSGGISRGAPGPADRSTDEGPIGRPAPASDVRTTSLGSQPPRRSAHRVGIAMAAALLVFVTVVLVLFVLFNTQAVEINLVFGTVEAPLVLALVFAAVLGGLVVGLADLALRGRRKHR